jgi:alpha-N-acetylglucosamine transferase
MGPQGKFCNKKFLLFYLLSISFTVYLLIASSSLADNFSESSTADNQFPHSTPYHGRYAIGAFLASKFNGKQDDSDDEDAYFVSARTLIYQLLHAPSTKFREPVPVIMLVTQDVRESKRQRLRDDGALVVEIEHLAHNMTITVERWVETVTKLRLFDPTVMPYEKVLLIDTDMTLTRPLDAIFQDPATELRHSNQSAHIEPEIDAPPDKFIMAASPESFQREHPYPFLDPDHKKSYFNSGLIMYSPSAELFQHYMDLINHPDLYYTGAPDQDILNYAHRWGGPMPWKRLHYSWYLNWPNDNDLKGHMALLHTKWWDHAYSYSSDTVEKFALVRRWEMEGYWIGKGKSRIHMKDGIDRHAVASVPVLRH